MITHDKQSIGAIASGQSRALGWLTMVVEVVETWLQRRRQRKALLELSDHVLKDIGISRNQAFQEGRKPFWQA
jgi:uncharacterized protein YjiS (DUF1127 family)